MKRKFIVVPLVIAIGLSVLLLSYVYKINSNVVIIEGERYYVAEHTLSLEETNDKKYIDLGLLLLKPWSFEHYWVTDMYSSVGVGLVINDTVLEKSFIELEPGPKRGRTTFVEVGGSLKVDGSSLKDVHLSGNNAEITIKQIDIGNYTKAPVKEHLMNQENVGQQK